LEDALFKFKSKEIEEEQKKDALKREIKEELSLDFSKMMEDIRSIIRDELNKLSSLISFEISKLTDEFASGKQNIGILKKNTNDEDNVAVTISGRMPWSARKREFERVNSDNKSFYANKYNQELANEVIK